MDLRDRIWNWIKKRPDWQSDLLRRLYNKGELDDEDIEEVKDNLLRDKTQDLKGRVIEKNDITASGKKSDKIRLRSLKNVKNVGKLIDDGRLDFTTDGITVIYGENGAGKSSYARILKKACRAVHDPDRIYSNIYEEEIKEGKATIEIVQDGTKKTIKREVNDPPDPSLRSISVYDKNCSDIYIDNTENVIPYAPQDLRIFSTLSSVQDEIADQLREKIKEKKDYILTKNELLEDFPNDSTISPLITELSHKTSIKKLKELKSLTDEEEKELKKKRKQLQGIDKEEINKKIKELEARKREVMQVETTISEAEDQLLDKIGKEIYQNAIYDLKKLQSAEKNLKQELNGEPLNGVGEGSWKVLWDAAKEYSEEHAYPGLSFPVTKLEEDDSARCVLCQQELTQEGIKRFKRFEDFVKDDISKKLKAKKDEIQKEISGLSKERYNISLGETIKTHLQDEHEELLNEIKEYNKKIKKLRSEVLEGLKNQSWPEKIKTTKVDELKKLIKGYKKAIEARINQQKNLFDEEKVSQIKKRVIELLAKKALGKRFDSIKEIISAKMEIHSLEKGINDLKTTAISRFQTKLVRDTIAPNIDSELQSQLTALRCDHLPVSIKGRSTKGSPISQVKYNFKRKNVPVNEIFSEGEKNGFSLAYFFTEVSQARANGTIILDDPVTSLDHERRDYVARTIASLAVNRQVIIFTHDIFFHSLLYNYSRTYDVETRTLWVWDTEKHTGNVEEQLPWEKRSPKQMIERPYALLKDLQNCFDYVKPDTKREKIERFYFLLRKSWEAVAEKIVFVGIIQRYDHAVHVGNIGKINLDEDIIEEIQQVWGRSSRFLHQEADLSTLPLPDLEQIESDFQLLKDFIKGHK